MSSKDVYRPRPDESTDRIITEGKFIAASHTENSPLNPEITLYEAAFAKGLPIILVPGQNNRGGLNDELVTLYTTLDQAKQLLRLRETDPDLSLVRYAFEGVIGGQKGKPSRAAKRAANRLWNMSEEEKMNAGRHHPLFNRVRHVTEAALDRALKTNTNEASNK